MSAPRHLLRAELRALRRDPSVWMILPLAIVSGAACAYWDFDLTSLDESLVPEAPAPFEEPSKTTCAPGEGEARALAIRGATPPWFTWYEPTVPEAEADVLAIFAGGAGGEPLAVSLFGQHREAELRAVDRCLWDQVREERHRRLDDLGLTVKAHHVAHGRAPDVPADPPPPPVGAPSTGGLIAVFLSFIGAMGWVTDALPKIRRSGWLEGLLALAVPRETLWWVWCAVSGAVALAASLCFSVAFLLGGGSLSLTAIAAQAPLAAAMAALSLRWLFRAPAAE